MVKPTTSLVLLVALGLALLFRVPAQAEHRATHLGHPATRFAPPVKTTGDLRKRFHDEKLRADVESILIQAGWKGNVDDLRYAALTAEIIEVELPVGTRMPFMSTREKGRATILIDVVWAGKTPVEAYAFYFSSNGRKYRCTTPKPCSNFYVEDMGPELPVLELNRQGPAQVSFCAPWELSYLVKNTGAAAANQVQLTQDLPPGWKTAEGQTSIQWNVGTLPVGASREFKVGIKPSAVGTLNSVAQVTSAEGISAEAAGTTVVVAPVLSVECNVPESVLFGRAAEACFTVLNTGTATEEKVTLTVPIPEGYIVESTSDGGVSADGVITWELTNLAANTGKTVCAMIQTPRLPGALPIVASVRGQCAPEAQSTCTTQVKAVSGILVEAIDLVDPVEVGQEVNYEIKVKNQGLLTGTNLRLVCTLPASQELVSAGGATAGALVDGNLVFEPLPSLEGRAVVTWTVTTKALKAEDARFNIDVRTDQFERPILEVESTHQY